MQRVGGRRSTAEVLAFSRSRVEPALRAAVDALPGPVRQVAGYHFGWWDEHGHPARSDGGKALRPALVLLAAEAVGADPGTAVPAAVAVELVHNFSLLHDDVMDGDVTRRHRPTAWRVFGQAAAILAGDGLLTGALDVVTASGHPSAQHAARMLIGAVQDLVAGQSADMGFEIRSDVELPECIDMARAKTGALLATACALGALYGGGRPDQVERFRAFGDRLGLAFQHVDDLIGIWGDPSVTGKPVYSDLYSRKKSLPVVAALTSDTAAGRELSALYHGGQPLTEGEVSRMAELIDAAGGRAWSRAQSDVLLREALEHLASATPAPGAAADLDALAALIVGRHH